MTEKQARRPPVAPKPSFIQQNVGQVTASSISPLPSPALRGAASAFGPSSLKSVNPTKPISNVQNPSAGALAAAAAAGKKQQIQPQRSQAPTQDPNPNFRGRSLTSDRLPIPASASSTQSSASPPKSGFLPHSPRSTSTVAAVAASANSSPVRRPALTKDQSGSYLSTADNSGDMRRRGMSTNSTTDISPPASKNYDALAGALASMTTGGSNIPAQKTGDKAKQDLGGVTHLTTQWSPQPQPAMTLSPSSTGTAAATAASRNATAFDMARKMFSPPPDFPSNESRMRSIPSSSPSNSNFTSPNVKVTPPQTDSESDAVRSAPERQTKPLPAPVPLRPSRAAMVAHEQANFNNNLQAANLDFEKQKSINALADAMIAGSIASSHAPSRVHTPAVPPPPPKPRRRSRSVGILNPVGRHHKHSHGLAKTTDNVVPEPPPPRTMRHTLRNQSPSRDKATQEQTKRGRKHWRRHPNMHHEGDRKRWRDKVTERERKRYEGVWAANRGLLFDYELATSDGETLRESPNELVTNVVVRDIWERSRLPRDVLEEVWELVAQPGSKALNREEFVVGLWLIDQRLKGRKLPVKVSPSVWSSVRHTQGVKISSKPIPK